MPQSHLETNHSLFIFCAVITCLKVTNSKACRDVPVKVQEQGTSKNDQTLPQHTTVENISKIRDWNASLD